MLLRKDPLLCDVTVVNDLRAVLYEALTERTSILNGEQIITSLSTWPMALTALERLQRFFSVSQAVDCAFAYPTLLYLPAFENLEESGYHFSAPPLLPMVCQRNVKVCDTIIRLKIPKVNCGVLNSTSVLRLKFGWQSGIAGVILKACGTPRAEPLFYSLACSSP